MMTTNRWTTLLAVVALTGTPVAAQTKPMEHGGGGMMGAHGMMGSQDMMAAQGMMQDMAPGAGAFLAAADPLGLTPDQRKSLEALRTTAQATRMAHMQAAMAARRSASEALSGDSPDLKAYGQALQAAADEMVQAQVAMARARIDARAVLTPDQRATVESGMALMGAMRGGMMDSGMMRGGTMPGGR